MRKVTSKVMNVSSIRLLVRMEPGVAAELALAQIDVRLHQVQAAVPAYLSLVNIYRSVGRDIQLT